MIASLSLIVGILSHGCLQTVYPSKSLLVTDLSVVESLDATALGTWTFPGVFDRLRSKDSSLEESIFSWLSEWDRRDNLNGFSIRPRSSERLLRLWPRSADGSLNLQAAPFRLLAIVNRPDLREGRFVFGAYDPMTNQPTDFSLIVEFPLGMDDKAFRDYQCEWANLSKHSFGKDFNFRLRRLTDRWFDFAADARIRTNDFLLLFEWELREFERDSEGWFRLVTTKQTPDFSLNETGELRAWIHENESSIILGNFEVPRKFLGGAAPVPADSFRWMLESGLDEGLRRSFSIQTCNGCHAGDTFTLFHHIAPRREGYEADLSPFIQMDLERRLEFLQALVSPESRRKDLGVFYGIGSRVH